METMKTKWLSGTCEKDKESRKWSHYLNLNIQICKSLAAHEIL